ncbi:PKD-like family lipoprotein [uncultured Chitinophaga sp.]|uniref:PKD-like family lipoprotein n=1 Tax=uncultured Chitinophaga sp. TaxID=339340 RepID=UPI0025EBCA6F|nr:PKD-like family lipoprotein [uncultured Chitinophaga sp.]
MKNLLLYIAAGVSLALASCSRDLGDYDYKEVPDPVVMGIQDSVFQAMVGDSLIIEPVVKLPSGTNKYSIKWKVDISDEMRSIEFEGKTLRFVFGIGSNRYPGLAVLTDSTTGMKYYYKFSIQGNTEFTRGTLILSASADKSHFSFVKEDGTVQADLYKAMNEEDIPAGGRQLLPIASQNYNSGAVSSYWITYASGAVQLDVNTLVRKRFLKDFFFNPPPTFDNGNYKVLSDGSMMAIMNGQVYFGAYETAPFATYFGFFGAPVNGRYNIGPEIIDDITGGAWVFMLGFDKEKKAFVRFSGRSFMDTTYKMLDSAFNPKNLGMSLIHMERFSDDNIYAFVDSAGLKVKELNIGVEFMGGDVFRAKSQRVSPVGPYLKPNTVWAKGIERDFYFSSGDKVYRYNPVNDEIRALAYDFGGKEVSMIKVLNNGDLMLAGTEGTVHYLDISTGRNGAFIKKIEGIPGSPKDVVIRN